MQYTVDPEVLAALMVKHGGTRGVKPAEEILCLAAVIVEHCAQIAEVAEKQDSTMAEGSAGARIRKEWGLR